MTTIPKIVSQRGAFGLDVRYANRQSNAFLRSPRKQTVKE